MKKNKICNRADLPKAVVLSCRGGSQGDLSVVRTLGREGVPVTVLSEYKESLALASRYCSEPIYLEGFTCDYKRTLNFLIDYANKQDKKPILFPTADPDLIFLSSQRDELEKYYHLYISRREIIENFMDKQKFYHFANKYNYPTPNTFIPNNLNDIVAISEKMQYPAIVKPALPLSWTDKRIQEIVDSKKAVTVGSRAELIDIYKKLSPYTNDALVQEYIHGGDDDLYSLHIYMNKESEPLGYFTGRKIRTYPTYAGIGCFVKSIYVEDIIKKGVEMLQKVNYSGLALLQFKRDSRSGEFKLIEINPRASSWNLLAYECGINLPFLAYADTVGIDMIRPGKQREGISYLFLKNDIKAYLDYRKHGEWTLLSWLNSLRGKKVYQIYASDDLNPFFVDLSRDMKRVFRKLLPGRG